MYECLENPAEDRIARSEWLLLSVIKNLENATLDRVKETLREKLKEIRKNPGNENVYLMWSSGYDLDKMLDHYLEFRMLEYVEDKKEWKLSDRGEERLISLNQAFCDKLGVELWPLGAVA